MSEIRWNDHPFDEQDVTAYALGAADDLDDATRAAIRTAIEADETLREEVTAIAAAATTIREALGAAVDPAPALDAGAREAVIEAAGAHVWTGGDTGQSVTSSPIRSTHRGGLLRPLAWPNVLKLPKSATLAVASAAVLVLGVSLFLTSAEFFSEPPLPRPFDSFDSGPDSSAAMPWVSPIEMGAAGEAMDADGSMERAEQGAVPEDIALTGQPMAMRLAATPAPPPPLTGGAANVPSGAVIYDSAHEEAIWPAPESPSQPRAPGLPPNFDPTFHSEGYAQVEDNPFRRAADAPLSTFSIDVDTASYSNVRRFIQQMGQLPPPDAVRIEEMINYFDYDYAPPGPNSEAPFAVHVEIADAPWRPEHRLVRIGLKGREIERDARPDTNLVFLIDVSGSMSDENRLPLVKRSLGLLVEQLGPRDRVGIVTYAGQSGVALRPTSGDDPNTIRRVIDALGAGGSTAGAAGIESAYDLAAEGYIQGGVNRVILLTDGDFNVGVTSHDQLQRIIEDKAKRGIFLSVLGFGMGNYKDDTLELLADKGNGNYGYIDTVAEARKLFVEQMSGTLVTIAKDVKIQVEFNPAEVEGYRLIGYENRMLAARDFNDDTKDAGEIGAGHTVTALYEVVPVGVQFDSPGIDPLRYGDSGADGGSEDGAASQDRSGLDALGDIDPLSADGPGELLFVKLRHKAPDSDTSTRLEYPVFDAGRRLGQASDDFHLAAAVAAFGMLLRESPYAGDATFEDALQLARSGRGDDQHGYRVELMDLIGRAGDIAGR